MMQGKKIHPKNCINHDELTLLGIPTNYLNDKYEFVWFCNKVNLPGSDLGIH